MTKDQAKYYRARLTVLRDLSKSERFDEMEQKRLLQGFVSPQHRDFVNTEIAQRAPHEIDIPLSTWELMSGSTWFAIHKNKVAGEPVAKSSLFFPVQIDGTEQDVKQMFRFLELSEKLESNSLKESVEKSEQKFNEQMEQQDKLFSIAKDFFDKGGADTFKEYVESAVRHLELFPNNWPPHISKFHKVMAKAENGNSFELLAKPNKKDTKRLAGDIYRAYFAPNLSTWKNLKLLELEAEALALELELLEL